MIEKISNLSITSLAIYLFPSPLVFRYLSLLVIEKISIQASLLPFWLSTFFLSLGFLVFIFFGDEGIKRPVLFFLDSIPKIYHRLFLLSSITFKSPKNPKLPRILTDLKHRTNIKQAPKNY